jgi:integrase
MGKEGRDVSTLKGLIDEYIELYAKPKKSSWHEDLRVLNKDVLPKWKYLKTSEITKGDVDKLLDKIVVYSSGAAADKTLGILQRMFAFAVTRGILSVSPCENISGQKEDAPKDRVLKEDEIKKIWYGLDAAKMSEGTKLAIKLLLVTGQRNGEVAGAKWKEFDLIKKWWAIDGMRTKNKKSHRVFLTQMAVDILREAKKLSGNSKWVFSTSKEGHITTRSISGAIKNNSEESTTRHPKHKPPYGDFFNIGYFAPHDMRRSMVTLLKEAGDLSVAKVQNHTTSTHKNHDDVEKQKTLEAWEQKLQEILFGWRKFRDKVDVNND